MSSTPYTGSQTLNEKTRLNLPISTFITLIIAVIGGAVWLTNLANTISNVREDQHQMRADISELKSILINNPHKVAMNP